MMIEMSEGEAAAASFGVWESRTGERLVASFCEPGCVRLDSSEGPTVVSDREWLRRWDELRDGGWTRAA